MPLQSCCRRLFTVISTRGRERTEEKNGGGVAAESRPAADGSLQPRQRSAAGTRRTEPETGKRHRDKEVWEIFFFFLLHRGRRCAQKALSSSAIYWGLAMD